MAQSMDRKLTDILQGDRFIPLFGQCRGVIRYYEDILPDRHRDSGDGYHRPVLESWIRGLGGSRVA